MNPKEIKQKFVVPAGAEDISLTQGGTLIYYIKKLSGKRTKIISCPETHKEHRERMEKIDSWDSKSQEKKDKIISHLKTKRSIMKTWKEHMKNENLTTSNVIVDPDWPYHLLLKKKFLLIQEFMPSEDIHLPRVHWFSDNNKHLQSLITKFAKNKLRKQKFQLCPNPYKELKEIKALYSAQDADE